MLVTVLAFIVVLGIVITVHEFGHFAMAKLLKIRVITFSLGFGPRLAGFTYGGTDYRISPLPLGGYVKMAGEAFDEDRQGAPDEFLSHPKWHRILVALAGPFMNVLLAIAIVATSFMEGMIVPRYLKGPAVIGHIVPHSPAENAGLMSKDRIISVEGNRVDTWQNMEIALATAPKGDLRVTVDRQGQLLNLRLTPPQSDGANPEDLGFKFMLPKTLVQDVDPDKPAQRAGLRRGDEIISVQGGGKEGRTHDEILNIIADSKGVPLKFEIRRPEFPPESGAGWDAMVGALERNVTVRTLTITPVEEKVEEKERVLIGFYAEIPADHLRYGLAGSVAQSIRHNYDMTLLTFKVIGRIIKGSASVRTISGPIEIASVAGSAARTRSARLFFGFIGILSLNLGIFNLLPIPILDGGVIFLLLIEGLMGRDLSLSIKEKIVQVGFVFLILLMGLVFINDLTKINFNSIFR